MSEFDFFACRVALKSELIEQTEALFFVARGFEVGTINEMFRLLNHERTVHQEQGLLRHGGEKPLRTAGVGTGEVKGAIQVWKILPVDVTVNRATRGKGFGRQLNRVTSGRLIEFSRHGQQRVAGRFKIKAAAVHFPEQLIARIQTGTARIIITDLLVSARKHEPAVQFLQRPTLVHETRGKVIEQLRMRRRLGAQSKIARRGDQPHAEMFQPNTVHNDACRKRIAPIRNGLGEFQSSAALLKYFAIFTSDNFQKLTRHIRTFIAGVAAKENMRVGGCWVVHQSHRARRGAGMRCLQLVHFSSKRAYILDRLYVE